MLRCETSFKRYTHTTKILTYFDSISCKTLEEKSFMEQLFFNNCPVYVKKMEENKLTYEICKLHESPFEKATSSRPMVPKQDPTICR